MSEEKTLIQIQTDIARISTKLDTIAEDAKETKAIVARLQAAQGEMAACAARQDERWTAHGSLHKRSEKNHDALVLRVDGIEEKVEDSRLTIARGAGIFGAGGALTLFGNLLLEWIKSRMGAP